MQYLLTAEEYKSIICQDEHTRQITALQETIDKLHNAVYPQTWCKGNFEKFSGYCDDCILSFSGTGTCPNTNKRYSK